MKRKVKAYYMKRVVVEVELEQSELDRVVEHGMPDWVDEKANEIDNEQPLEFDYWDIE